MKTMLYWILAIASTCVIAHLVYDKFGPVGALIYLVGAIIYLGSQ